MFSSLIFCSCAASTNESPTKHTIAKIVPITINGVRLPYLVFVLSDKEPKIGNMNNAKMLSKDMIRPDQVWSRPNLFVSIRGMIASYACQKALIRKNANPTRIVRLVFSFIKSFPFDVFAQRQVAVVQTQIDC